MDIDNELSETNIYNIYDTINKENDIKNNEINTIDKDILELDISIDKCKLNIENLIKELNNLNQNNAKTNFEKEQYYNENEKINKNIKITTNLINENTDLIIKKKEELLDYKKEYNLFIVKYFNKLAQIGDFFIEPIINKEILNELDINILDCANYNIKQVIDFIITNKKTKKSHDLLEELTSIVKNQCEEKNILLLDKIKYTISNDYSINNNINIYQNMNIENIMYGLTILILYYYYSIPSNIILLSLILYYYPKKKKNIILCNEIDIKKINQTINNNLDIGLQYYYHLFSFFSFYTIYYILYYIYYNIYI